MIRRNTRKIFRAIPLFLLACLTNLVYGQKLTIKNYSFGYRVFEMNSFGNNPTTITNLLKDPAAYQNFLTTLTYNGFYGNPGISNLHTFYISAEFGKDLSQARFWRKYSIQAGLLFTTKSSEAAGALSNQFFTYSPDTVMHDNRYSLVKNQQFMGIQTGLNRRFKISKKFHALLGLYVQGSFAIINNYQQQMDTSTFSTSVGWKRSSTPLPALKRKNYFQWQAMIPLGLEYGVYQNRITLRIELDIGIMANPYIGRTYAERECNGWGISIIYRPKL